MSNTIGPWQYEKDPYVREVHYAWRRNDSERGGIERKVFSSKVNAMRFLKEKNPPLARSMERESMNSFKSRPAFCSRCGAAIRICTARVCTKGN